MRYIVFVSAITLLFGCTHLYKYYDFRAFEGGVAGGKIKVQITGRWNSVSRSPEITERGNPYYIDVDFITKDAPGKGCKLKIDRLVLKSGRIIELGVEELTTTKKQRLAVIYRSAAHARFRDIIIDEYAPLTLKGSVTYENIEYPLEITLKTKYIGIYQNNYIDAMIGI